MVTFSASLRGSSFSAAILVAAEEEISEILSQEILAGKCNDITYKSQNFEKTTFSLNFRAEYEEMRDDLLGDSEQLEEEVGFGEIMIESGVAKQGVSGSISISSGAATEKEWSCGTFRAICFHDSSF